MLEGYTCERLKAQSRLHYPLTEAIKLGFADRDRYSAILTSARAWE